MRPPQAVPGGLALSPVMGQPNARPPRRGLFEPIYLSPPQAVLGALALSPVMGQPNARPPRRGLFEPIYLSPPQAVPGALALSPIMGQPNARPPRRGLFMSKTLSNFDFEIFDFTSTFQGSGAGQGIPGAWQ